MMFAKKLLLGNQDFQLVVAVGDSCHSDLEDMLFQLPAGIVGYLADSSSLCTAAIPSVYIL